jgi:small subunit ribosomal protein S6
MPGKARRTALSPRLGHKVAANLPRSMTGFYDLVLLIDPNAPEERRTSAVSEAESLLSSGGEIVTSQDWGQRRMAYEIDHRPEAEYRLYQFNGDNDLLERLNQRLRINDAVLRFRIIKAKPGQPLPPPPEQQSPRRRDDREPQDTRVAARAAADAPAQSDAPPGEEAAAGDPATPAPAGAVPVAEGAPPAAPAEAASDAPPAEAAPTDAASSDAASAEPAPAEAASEEPSADDTRADPADE